MGAYTISREDSEAWCPHHCSSANTDTDEQRHINRASSVFCRVLHRGWGGDQTNVGRSRSPASLSQSGYALLFFHVNTFRNGNGRECVVCGLRGVDSDSVESCLRLLAPLATESWSQHKHTLADSTGDADRSEFDQAPRLWIRALLSLFNSEVWGI